MDDMISRQAAIDALAEQMPTPYTPDGSHPADEGIFAAQEVYADCIETIKLLPSAQPERMTNRQWIDFLSAQFDISRTSAKGMLHGMMQWKKEDNFKKLFNGGQDETD